MIDIIKKITFTFSKMFENVHFFRMCIQSFQKVLKYVPQILFSSQKIKMGIKNAEFYAYFELVDAGF
jgi:hypothetical protein